MQCCKWKAAERFEPRRHGFAEVCELRGQTRNETARSDCIPLLQQPIGGWQQVGQHGHGERMDKFERSTLLWQCNVQQLPATQQHMPGNRDNAAVGEGRGGVLLPRRRDDGSDGVRPTRPDVRAT
jgi:hypothetical protein